MTRLSNVFFFAVLGAVGVSTASAASLYVTVQSPAKVVAVDEATGTVTDVITSGLLNPRGIAFNPLNGDFFVADAPSSPNNYAAFDTLTIKHYSPGGSFIGSFNAGPDGPFGGGLAFSSSGNLYVAAATADGFGFLANGQVREYSTAGVPLAQSSGGASIPIGLGINNASGDVFASDGGGAVWKYSAALTSPTLFANTGVSEYGVAVAGNGNVYVGQSLFNKTLAYDSLGNSLYQQFGAGGQADVLASDGFLYALTPPNIFRLNVSDGTLASFSAINTSSLPAAQWMAEQVVPTPEPASWILGVVGFGGLMLLRRKMRRPIEA